MALTDAKIVAVVRWRLTAANGATIVARITPGVDVFEGIGAQEVHGVANPNQAFSDVLQKDEVLLGIRGICANDGLRSIVFVIQDLKTGEQVFRSPARPNSVLGNSYGFELPRQCLPPFYPTATIAGFHGRYYHDSKQLKSIGAIFTPYNVVGP